MRIELQRDSRLASRYEKKLLAEVIHRMFGARIPLSDRIVLLHRVPSQGYGVEVYYDAARIGVLEYSPTWGGWVLHPYAALAYMLVGLGAPVNYEVNVSGRVKGKRIAETEYRALEKPAGSWSIVDANGALGVARLEPDGSLRIRDVVRARIRPLGPSASPSRVNKGFLDELVEEAVGFLRERLAGRRAYVMLSGGMDSEAAAALAVEALGPENLHALHIDTGIGFREARRHAFRVAGLLDLDIEVLGAGEETYWRELAARGLNTRSRRWCTEALKLEPVRRRFGGVEHHVVEGIRVYESASRARAPRIRRNPLVRGQVQYFPILMWPRLYVQLFLEARGLPTNPLYEEGLERVGCAVCPAMHIHEMLVARRLEPAIHRRFVEALSHLAGLSPSCVEAAVYSAAWRDLSRRGVETLLKRGCDVRSATGP